MVNITLEFYIFIPTCSPQSTVQRNINLFMTRQDVRGCVPSILICFTLADRMITGQMLFSDK